MLRWITSKLADRCGNVFFFSKELRVSIADELRVKPSKINGKQTALSVAALTMALAVADEMKPGDKMTAEFEGAEYGGEVKGDFKVVVEKL